MQLPQIMILFLEGKSIILLYDYTNAVPCGVPSPPIHGTIHEFSGTEVVYICDAGFDPASEMMATCQSGNWRPAPPADLTCEQLATGSEYCYVSRWCNVWMFPYSVCNVLDAKHTKQQRYTNLANCWLILFCMQVLVNPLIVLLHQPDTLPTCTLVPTSSSPIASTPTSAGTATSGDNNGNYYLSSLTHCSVQKLPSLSINLWWYMGDLIQGVVL